MEKAAVGSWSGTDWEEISPGMSQRACAEGLRGLCCRLRRVENGHQVRPHSHTAEQAVFILSGECDYYIDNKPYRLSTGSWVAVPSGAEHYPHVYDSTAPCLQLVVSGPGSLGDLEALAARMGLEGKIGQKRKKTGRRSENEPQ